LDLRLGLIGGGLPMVIILAPSIAYFAAERGLGDWIRAVLVWAVAYGSQDLLIFRAVARCLLRQPLAWVPTNARARLGRFDLLPELCVGTTLAGAALLTLPVGPALVAAVVLGGKFLIAPLVHPRVFGSRPSADGVAPW